MEVSARQLGRRERGRERLRSSQNGWYSQYCTALLEPQSQMKALVELHTQRTRQCRPCAMGPWRVSGGVCKNVSDHDAFSASFEA